MRSDASIGISQKEYAHHNQLQTGEVYTDAQGRQQIASKAPFQPSNISIDLPHYVVFIYGMEVTESIVALNFNHNLDGDPGIATIELMNNEDQWVITPRNLGLTIFTGDSRAHSPGEFVQYGLSDETLGGNNDFTKKANNKDVNNPVPNISVNYNITGGAVDHRMGLRDAYNQDLVKDVLKDTDENKRAWKNGKIIVKKLYAKDDFGKDTTELLGLNGRFRLDPFSSSLNINLDNWYEMYHEGIKQPELFRYSEYKKMLVYLTKANALIAYHNDDTRGIEDQIKRWKLEEAAVNDFNKNRKFDQIQKTESNLEVSVVADLGTTTSVLELVAKDIPVKVTIDPNTGETINSIDQNEAKKRLEDLAKITKPTIKLSDPKNQLIKLNSDKTDIDVSKTKEFNASDKDGFGAQKKLEKLLQDALSQKNKTNNSQEEAIWELKSDPFDINKAVYNKGAAVNIKDEDGFTDSDILPPFSINIEGTLISNLNEALGKLKISKVKDVDDPNGWTFYLSGDKSVSLTVAPATNINTPNKEAVSTFLETDDLTKNFIYYRLILSDGGESETSFESASFEFKKNMRLALEAIKKTFVTFVKGDDLKLFDEKGKELQVDLNKPISATDNTTRRDKITSTFIEKGLQEVKIFGHTDPSLQSELAVHPDTPYIAEPQNLQELNLSYDVKFETFPNSNKKVKTVKKFSFEFREAPNTEPLYEVPKIVNFDYRKNKPNFKLSDKFEDVKPIFTDIISGNTVTPPPSPFADYILPKVNNNGDFDIEMVADTKKRDFDYSSEIIDMKIDENEGQIILSISTEANNPHPDIFGDIFRNRNINDFFDSNNKPNKITPIYQFSKNVHIGGNSFNIDDIPNLVTLDTDGDNKLNPQRMVINYRYFKDNSFSVLNETPLNIDDTINLFGLNRSLNNLGFGFKVVKFNVISPGVIPFIVPTIDKDPGFFVPKDAQKGGILDPDNLDGDNSTRAKYLHVTYRFYILPPLHDGIISIGLKTGKKSTDGLLGIGFPTQIQDQNTINKVLACIPDLRFNETGLFKKSNYVVNDDESDIKHREWEKDFNNWRVSNQLDAIAGKLLRYHYVRGVYNGSWSIDDYRGQTQGLAADFTLENEGTVIGSTLNDYSIPIVVSDHYNSSLSYARANEVRNFFIYDKYNQGSQSNTIDSNLSPITSGDNEKFFIKGESYRNSIDEYSLLANEASSGDPLDRKLLTNIQFDDKDGGKATNRRVEIIIVIDKKPFDDLASAGSGKRKLVKTQENQTPHKIIYKQTYSLIKKTKPEAKTFETPPPSNAPIITRLYPMRPGDPIFHSMDPVRIFERSKYPERWVDEDGKVFDDHVYYHAFSGFVESLQKTTSGGDRRLIVEAKDMRRLLQISKLAVKPAVVNERNLDTNLLGLTPFQENYVLDSVRTLCERIIGAKGEFNKSGGVSSIPTNTAKNLIQAQQNSADAKIEEAKVIIGYAQGINLNLDKYSTNLSYLFTNNQYKELENVLQSTYGIIIKFYLKSTLSDTKIFPFDLKSGFSDGKISGTSVNGGVLTGLGIDLSTTDKFLNNTIFEDIQRGNYVTPELVDFENIFHAKLKLEEYVDFFKKHPSGNGTEKFNSWGNDFINTIIIVAFRDPAFKNFENLDIKTLPYALQVSRAEKVGKALLKAPQNQVSNKNIKPVVDANKSHIVVSDDALRYIDPVTDKFVEIFDPKQDHKNNNISSTNLVNDKLDEAFQKCISKPRNRIFPYVRTPSGVGNYGVRVATILGSIFEDVDKDGKKIRNPNLSNTAKQFQAVWELEEMHPRYRNPQVIRETFGLLPILFAMPLKQFSQYNGSVVNDTNGEVDSVDLKDVQKTWEQINKSSKRIDNFILDALGEKFFELLDKVGDANAGNLINALDPQKNINAESLLNASTDPTIAGYIKSTLMDILIKHEIECGYLYIMEPQGFVSSTIHPYNPHIDGFSLFDFNMKDRLQIINEATQNIGFHFYATPKGDFVMQPPMLPFSPRHFSLAYDEHGMTGKKKGTTSTVTKQATTNQTTNTPDQSVYPLNFEQDGVKVRIESPTSYFIRGEVSSLVNSQTATLADVPNLVSMRISVTGDRNQLIPVDNLLGPIREVPLYIFPNGLAGPVKVYSWLVTISGPVPKQINLLLQTTDDKGNTIFQLSGTAKTQVDFVTVINVPQDILAKITTVETPPAITTTIEVPDTSITKRIGGGLYNRQYFLDSMHITSIDWREDTSKIVNAVEAVGAFPFFNSTQEKGVDPWRAVIMRGDLIGRYGLRFEVFHNEILRSQSNAAAFAYIKMQEINRTVLTVAAHAQTCPSLLLCRPLEIPREYVCGYIRHISVSWSASNGRQTQIELWDCRKINVNSGSTTFVPLTDFDRVDLLNMQSFWADRKSGRSIDELKTGDGSDNFISEANRFESQIFQQDLGINSMVKLNGSTSILNFDLTNQMALILSDPDNDKTLRKFLELNTRGIRQGR